MSYSNVEKMDMLKCYTQCNNNAIAAVKLYAELYGDRTIPIRFTFSRVQKNLLLHGSFNKNNRKSVRCKRVINEKNKILLWFLHIYIKIHIHHYELYQVSSQIFVNTFLNYFML